MLAPAQQTHTFTAVDGVDWAGITKWKRVYPPAYDPDEVDLMGEELGDGKGEAVVQPCCSTAAIPCVFREELLAKCLDTKPECPTCKFQYTTPGPQPSGTMHVTNIPTPCTRRLWAFGPGAPSIEPPSSGLWGSFSSRVVRPRC